MLGRWRHRGHFLVTRVLLTIFRGEGRVGRPKRYHIVNQVSLGQDKPELGASALRVVCLRCLVTSTPTIFNIFRCSSVGKNIFS